MTGCDRKATGGASEIVLYFYDELEPRERSGVEQHLQSCAECRRAFEELSTIRSALAATPTVDAPPGGDWTPFMKRLDEAVRLEARATPAALPGTASDTEQVRIASDVVPFGVPSGRLRVGYASYLAMAALLTLVTSGVVYVARSTARPPSVPSASPAASPSSVATVASEPGQRSPSEAAPVVRSGGPPSAAAAFVALSEQHFERSKLVVLGLANKDPHRAREGDWAYERGLASNLLSDTRLYRVAAEERGMKTLAGVMGDLEIVLLQTALAHAPDTEALEQIQRLIHKRDLITKMDVTTGS